MELLPAAAQATPESDSDSGMGSPADEMDAKAANNTEELQGEITQQYMIIQPEIVRVDPLWLCKCADSLHLHS